MVLLKNLILEFQTFVWIKEKGAKKLTDTKELIDGLKRSCSYFSRMFSEIYKEKIGSDKKIRMCI